jgi:putative PEP-CTERM system histidine kinase
MSLPTLGSPALLARLAMALAIVLLAENLYRNADETARWHVNLPCIALGSLACLDVLVYADAVLSREFSRTLLDARALVTALTMPLLAIAAARGRRWRRQVRVSRAAVFHGTTLVVGGGFLLSVGVVGEVLRQLGTDWGKVAQVSLIAAALIAVAVAVSSQSARSRIRGLVVDHFFAARYDYRREWLRCVDTLSGGAEESVPAPERAIRAIADAVDSPAGAVLTRDAVEEGTAARFRWSGSWNLPEDVSLALPSDHPLITEMRGGGWVALLEDNTPADVGQTLGRLWLGVPLLHHREGVLGIVVLAPPRAPFELDVETFDLLRTLGQEVAMFLAERRAAERLADQRKVQDYARRFAFVAHDVKTVSSQLGLLLANAEENISDPEFQRDMLLTVRASADRIRTLIIRLRQPEDEPAAAAPVTPARAEGCDPRVRLMVIAAARRHPVLLDPADSAIGLVAIEPAQFDAAVTHLLDNAIEASPEGEPVRNGLRREGGRILVDIVDRGAGMTAEFVRDRLFRPMVTSKAHGNGIGVWQARDLLQKAGGDLLVLTRPGAGTTMRLLLLPQAGPISGAASERLSA